MSSRASRHVAHGRAALQQGRFAAALGSLLQALQAMPALTADTELEADVRTAAKLALQYGNGGHREGSPDPESADAISAADGHQLYGLLLHLYPNSWPLLHDYAFFLVRCHEPVAGLKLLKHALQLAPHHPVLLASQDHLRLAAVDRWHYPMVNDSRRNTAYRAAIEQAVARFCSTHGRAPVVLDIGAGTGLLSMYAAAAGAAQVFACEMNLLLADVAADCLRINGMDGRVTLLRCHSTSLQRGGTTPEGVRLPEQGFDLIVTELVDAGLLGEHIRPVLQHAVQHLGSKHCVWIPYSAKLAVCGLTSSRLARRTALLPSACSDTLRALGLPQLAHLPTERYTCAQLTAPSDTPLTPWVWLEQAVPLVEPWSAVQTDHTLVVTAHGPGQLQFWALAWRLQLLADEPNLSISALPDSADAEDACTCWQTALFPALWTPTTKLLAPSQQPSVADLALGFPVAAGDQLSVQVHLAVDGVHVAQTYDPGLLATAWHSLADACVLVEEEALAVINDTAAEAFMATAAAHGFASLRPHASVVLVTLGGYWPLACVQQALACKACLVVVIAPEDQVARFERVAGLGHLPVAVLALAEPEALLDQLSAASPSELLVAVDLVDSTGALATEHFPLLEALDTFCAAAGGIPLKAVPEALSFNATLVAWDRLPALSQVLPGRSPFDLAPLNAFAVGYHADVAQQEAGLTALATNESMLTVTLLALARGEGAGSVPLDLSAVLPDGAQLDHVHLLIDVTLISPGETAGKSSVRHRTGVDDSKHRLCLCLTAAMRSSPADAAHGGVAVACTLAFGPHQGVIVAELPLAAP